MDKLDKEFKNLRISMRIYDIITYICIVAVAYSLFKHIYLSAIISTLLFFIVHLKGDMVILEYKDMQFTEAMRLMTEGMKKEVSKKIEEL